MFTVALFTKPRCGNDLSVYEQIDEKITVQAE